MTATASTGRLRSPDRPDLPTAHAVGLAVAALVWAATAVVQLLQPQEPLDRWTLVPTTLMFACGAIIVIRTQTRVIGWLLVVSGALQPLVSVYFQGGPAPPPETAFTNFLVTVGEWGNVAILLLLLTYPTGRLETRGTRVAAAVLIALELLLFPFEVLNVLGLTGPPPAQPLGFVFAGFAVMLLFGIGSQVRRYRRRPRVEQLQIKWFLLGIGVWLLYPLAFALDVVASGVWGIVITAPLPLAILAAITRYRLYEIDRIISRTVGYAIVVAVLAGLGVGGVAVVTSLLPTQDRLAVVLTTLGVVALFDPLRRRVTVAVDRRFDRTRYVARQVVEDFGRQVQDVTDLDEVVDRVHAVTGTTLAPATVAVWQPAAVEPR